ncbi:Sm-like protein LSM6A [Glycine max]|nr:Sm-like protein LSM6A [Glycine max]
MSGTEKAGSGTTKTPADFLKSIRGRPVVVKLNSGVDYRGILACLDGYMNIAMEQTEEYVNGQLKNKYGDAFIRGNNEYSILFWKFKIAIETAITLGSVWFKGGEGWMDFD